MSDTTRIAVFNRQLIDTEQFLVPLRGSDPSDCGDNIFIGNMDNAFDWDDWVVTVCDIVPLNLKRQIVFHTGMKFSLQDAEPVAESIYVLAERGPVLLHCVGGIDRSPTLALVYFMHCLSLSQAVALERIKSARPLATPHPDWLEE